MNPVEQLLLLMRALEPWPALALLLELALKSLLVLAAFGIAALCCRRHSAVTRHLLWCLCMLTLCSLPLFTILLPKFVLTLESLPSAAAGAGPDSLAFSEFIVRWWPLASRGYLLICLLLVLYSLGGLAGMYLLTRNARPSANTLALRMLQDRLDDELSEIRVALREHPQVGSPLSWGLLNPVIILPTSSNQWDEAKLRHVILHELAHIQRLDWVSHLVSRYVCAIFWYNPLAWLAARNLDETAEQSCDDLVLLQTQDYPGYADALVSVARHAGGYSMPRLAQALTGSFLGSRIVAILDARRGRQQHDSEKAIAGVLIAFALGALLSSLSIAARQSAEPTRYYVPGIQVDYIPARNAAPFPATGPAPTTPLPVLITLSSNYPELDTVIVEGPTADEFTAGSAAGVPAVTVEAVLAAGTRQPALLLYKRFPHYPSRAEQMGIEGYTTVEYEIDARGQVIDALVVDASPDNTFNAVSLEAIREYRYDPPRVNGQPHGIKGLRTRFVYRLDPDPG